MAVAGLHNVSVLDSAFLRESQSEVVRRQGDDGRTSNRASSILQMWRELEDQHSPGRASERLLQHRADGLGADFSDSHSIGHTVTSEDMNAGETEYRECSPSLAGSENGQDNSSDLGEIERERVRQIFQEWMTSGSRECASGIQGRDNIVRGEWLGETEQERVRIIREWVQMNSRQRGVCIDQRAEQNSDVVGQIEQVLDGSVVNNNEGQSEHTRRGIRRLCGRQALLDMLKKAERERQIEIQGLLEHHAVSQFAHRNRIQSLLRGRFLRNDRVIEDKRHMSRAASELGLLRQRHTVSDLRVGFSFRLDHSVSGQVSNGNESSDTSSNADINSNESEQQLTHDSQTKSNVAESGSSWLSDGRTGMADTNQEERFDSLEEMPENISENQGIRRQQLADAEVDVGRGDTCAEEIGNQMEVPDNGLSIELFENEVRQDIYLLSPREIPSQEYEPSMEESSVPRSLNDLDGALGIAVESFHESAVPVEQLQDDEALESEDERDFFVSRLQSNDSQGNDDQHVHSGASLQSNEQGYRNRHIAEEHQHETNTNERLENENQEEMSGVWHEEGSFQEAVPSWLEPSDQDAVPIRRMGPFYLPDSDNVYSTELRELLSRRSVSTLLRSGFRQSLDQLIRSYVERQTNASLEWEMQETSPTPASAEQDAVHPRDQDEDEEGARESSPFALHSPSMPPVRQLWDRETHHYSWPQHDMHQQFGIEWDIINDLRIDMARLQQRMNNMQRMLEACMDMQLELQRSIRQEVSAALNRSASSSGKCENSLLEDKSKWDDVRKGLCCICRSSNIDSLLYRCGHMCTCSKCANKLFQSGGKCPMCWAPVIEVIRAYSIL